MTLAYYNGAFTPVDIITIHPQDSGFMTGIGIFDSMLAHNGIPIHINEHFERIEHDTKIVIGIKPPLPLGEGRGEGVEEFKKIIQSLIEKNNLTSGYARIRTTITGGIVDAPLSPSRSPTIYINVAACAPPPETPITCAVITDYPRIAGCMLENCKRLDYTRSFAARRAAEKLGATEAIITNTNGNIACGATSNIFIKENGVFITPPLTEGVLAGITRRKILEENNTREETISKDRLLAAEKAYLSNSFTGLREIILKKD